MNILYLIILFKFSLVKAVNVHPHYTDNEFQDSEIEKNNPSMPSNVRLKLTTKFGHHENINFKKTNQILANNNLPIWVINGVINEETTRDICSNKLILMPKVMKRLGKFTMYQDPETTSAAVYFHRRQKFDGVIDYRYVIQGLEIDPTHPNENELLIDESAIVSRNKLKQHESEDIKVKKEGMSTENENGNSEITKNSPHLYHGYPEILVIVSCEMAQELMKNKIKSERYTSIVSYVLTLFNSADMLYSKLDKTEIKLNIAGIIIESTCGSLAFLDKCYDEKIKNEIPKNINAECVNENLENYFFTCRELISTDSYDSVVLLTRHNLYAINKDANDKTEIEYLQGLSNACYNIYETKKSNGIVILPAVIQDVGNFESYAIIAHEIAHLMTVLHDDQPYVKDGKCCGCIMRDGCDGSWCKSCLSWSDESEDKLNQFFRSPDCCAFINLPRSINPQGPKEVLTVDQQCQCYGHKGAMIFNRKATRDCQAHLICTGTENSFYNAPIPMDGTPCDYEKVCWNNKCVEIQKGISSRDTVTKLFLR